MHICLRRTASARLPMRACRLLACDKQVCNSHPLQVFWRQAVENARPMSCFQVALDLAVVALRCTPGMTSKPCPGIWQPVHV